MPSVLERGELFFFYRPRVGVQWAHGLDEVSRFFMIMRPRDREIYRRMIIGRKRLPDIHEREWALVDLVAYHPADLADALRSHVYETTTRGEREEPAARPVGEAVYAIVEHDEHRHLAYRLEFPRDLGEVQYDFGVRREANFVVTVFNPFTRRDHPSDYPRYPNRLQARFRRRRFAPLDPEFLDYEGTEIVMIGAAAELRRDLDHALDPQHESITEAAILRDLLIDVREHPIEPLVRGIWA